METANNEIISPDVQHPRGGNEVAVLLVPTSGDGPTEFSHTDQEATKIKI